MKKINKKDLDLFYRDGYIRFDNVFSLQEILKIRKAFDDAVKAPPKEVKVVYEDNKGSDNKLIARSVMG